MDDYDEFDRRHVFNFDYSNINRVSEIKAGIYFIEPHIAHVPKLELRPAKKRAWKQDDLTVRGRGWLSLGTPWEVTVLKQGRDPRGRPFTRVTFKTWGHYLAHPPEPYKDKTGRCEVFLTQLHHEDIVAWELRPVGAPGSQVEAYEIVVPNCPSDPRFRSELIGGQGNEDGHECKETIGLFSQLKVTENGILSPSLGPFQNTRQFRSWRVRPSLPQDQGYVTENVDRPAMDVSPVVYLFAIFLLIVLVIAFSFGTTVSSLMSVALCFALGEYRSGAIGILFIVLWQLGHYGQISLFRS